MLSTTRVSLVQNKFLFCQLRVHYIGDPEYQDGLLVRNMHTRRNAPVTRYIGDPDVMYPLAPVTHIADVLNVMPQVMGARGVVRYATPQPLHAIPHRHHHNMRARICTHTLVTHIADVLNVMPQVTGARWVV